jgi:S-layer protein
MTTVNGTLSYSNRVTPVNSWFRSDEYKTKPGVIKSGQVLKKGTFLQSDGNGKLIAHTGIAESSIVTFATITTGQTIILGGLTFTAGSGSVTAAQLVTIWSNLPAGIGYVAAAAQILAAGIDASVQGTFTAGTFGSFNTRAYNTTNKVIFTATTMATNVTSIVDSGTATDPTVSTVEGATFAPIAGLTLYDVNGTSADVNAEVLIEASLWADYLVWYVDTATDTITLYDGSTVACTAYNTGTTGYDTASTNLLKAKFVESSMFEPLGFIGVGETRNV